MAKRKKSQKSKSSKKPNNDITATANQQVNSKFMQLLPQEIRDEIYASVFRSTRFASGMRTGGRCDGRQLVSSFRGTALALLRTCRRVRDEIGISWLHRVLFHFEDNDSLLDKFAGLPVTLRKQIRHVRVLENSVMIWVDGDDSYHSTAQIFKLLPGLELDTLTVLGDSDSTSAYENLDKLVRYGDGWKVLHYLTLTPSSDFLGYKLNDELMLGRHLRQPQPSNWQNALEQRDGRESRTSVVVYRSTVAATPGAVLQFDFDRREVITQALTDKQDGQIFGHTGDDTSMRPEEVREELLVLVKRGNGVSYAVKKGSPYLPIDDIRQCCPGMTWEDIKAQQAAWSEREFGPSIETEDDDEHDDEVVVDTYRHVDEYTWPLRFD